jgi:hypothetical protein
MQEVYNEKLETTPEKALISSYIIKLLNRNASSKVDRLLKDDYEEIKRNPLILDTILRAQLMAFFSKTGSIELTKQLMRYYREYKLFSALIDAKNILVICSKENIDKSSIPFNPSMGEVVKKLISSDKSHIVRNHIKSALASCILTGNLGEEINSLIRGEYSGELDPEVEELLLRTSRECREELKNRIEDSKPKN